MSPQHRVTTVVITRDRREQLLRTLARHTGPVVVVDNGSTDGTVEAVERAHPEVRVVPLARNLAAAGRTVGAEVADTPYVAFADDDSWWEPGSLERAAEAFDEHPALSALVASVVVEPAGRPDSFNDVLAASPLPPDERVPGVPVLGFMACALVVRRDAFLAVGGFDRVFRVGGEEQLLAVDLVRRGGAVQYWPELVAHHEPAPGSGRQGRDAQLVRAALITAVLRRPWPVVAGEVATAVRSGPAGRRGLASAAVELPRLLGRRRVVEPELERRLRLLTA